MSVVSLGLALNKCGYTNNCSTTCYCNKRFLWPEVVQRGQTWPRQTQPTVGNISQTCSWVWLQSGILISEPFADRFQADLSVRRGGWLWWKPPIVLWASFFANVWRGNHRENCCWKFVFGFFFFSYVSGGCMSDVTILKVFLMYLSEFKLTLLASKSPSLRNAVMWQKHYWGVCGRESAGECIVNWLKGSRVIMLTFVNTFLSFVF